MKNVFLNRKPLVLIVILLLITLQASACSNSHKNATPATQQRFDDIDFWVKMFEDPKRDAWQRPQEVVKTMNLKAGNVVADIGAGTGYFTRHLAVAVGPDGSAIGLDIELSMVKYMKEDAKKLNLSNYKARVVGTDDPEIETGSVDVVFLCNTYHHIENRVKYFSHILNSLKENGRVVVVDFYKNTDFGPPRDHKMAKETVIEEMKQAGYNLLKSHDLLEQQYFLEFSP